MRTKSVSHKIPSYELPSQSKWHGPSHNRIIQVHDAWVEIEIWPEIIIKIDLPDLEFVMRHRWNVKRGRAQGVLIVNCSEINGKRGQLTLQKCLLGGSKKDFACFVNKSERLDFRRSNIEGRDYQTRSIKQRKRKTPTTSIYRGVSLIAKTKKWAAQICVNQISINLGTFDCELEAALCYNRASRKYFGEDGYQNELVSKKVKRIA